MEEQSRDFWAGWGRALHFAERERRKRVGLQVPGKVTEPLPSPCPLRQSPALLPEQRPQPAPRLSPSSPSVL